MKSVKFWKTKVRQISLTERIFYRNAIKTLLSWDTMGEECIELEVISRILDSEIKVFYTAEEECQPTRKNSLSKRQSFENTSGQTVPQKALDDNWRPSGIREGGPETETASAIPDRPLPISERPAQENTG